MTFVKIVILIFLNPQKNIYIRNRMERYIEQNFFLAIYNLYIIIYSNLNVIDKFFKISETV